MALTRKFLSALEIEPDKIDEIISAHADTVEALKAERDAVKKDFEKYKEDAEKLPAVQKELDDLKNSQGTNIFETRYNEMKEAHDKIKAEFDKYKSDADAKEIKRAKENAYRQLLKDAKISDKRIDKIIKVSDLDSMKLDKDGKLEDVENLTKSIKEDWGDFIVTENQVGANVSNPPANTGGAQRNSSRAAQMVAQYRNEHYGNPTKEV